MKKDRRSHCVRCCTEKTVPSPESCIGLQESRFPLQPVTNLQQKGGCGWGALGLAPVLIHFLPCILGKPDGFLLGPSAEMFQDIQWDPLQFQIRLQRLQHHSPGDLLSGLVQTIKDHITKPTAMAHGRVAHLIEWKGWSAPQVGCEPWLMEEEHYSYLTDELREARFAAGVAEQFAITEATLSAWSSLDDEEMNYGGSSQEIVQLQDLESIYLQEKLLLSPQVISSPNLEGSLPACSSSTHTSPIPWVHSGVDRRNSIHPFPGALPCGSPQTGSSQADSSEKEQACVGRRQEGMTSACQKRLSNSLHDVDSSSLSEEDEVFYN
ncbi:protein FAM131C isoform X1 [Lepidochelys kempii]|uniref:protein FAM131C isoform X1 n=1 Tax=Lepidochelys kempii TaxID=8472 RepID=UPI003C706067